MSSFPTLAPSTRAYDPGDWPVRTYKANDGTEIRFLYGDTRADSKLQLTYENIPDATAEAFVNHYYAQKGTFRTFALPAELTVVKGWQGSSTFFNAGVRRHYRYAEAPKVTGVRPGRSSVSISLIGVIVG